MRCSETQFEILGWGTADGSSEPVPVPPDIRDKDSRIDPLARCAVASVGQALSRVAKPFPAFGVIVLTEHGCQSHLQKVIQSAQTGFPRQGFFVRAGPQTLATYSALAFNQHLLSLSIFGASQEFLITCALISNLLLRNCAPVIALTATSQVAASTLLLSTPGLHARILLTVRGKSQDRVAIDLFSLFSRCDEILSRTSEGDVISRNLTSENDELQIGLITC